MTERKEKKIEDSKKNRITDVFSDYSGTKYFFFFQTEHRKVGSKVTKPFN
jgi:hypothetical protein